MRPATPAPKLGAGNGDDLDPRLAQQGVGMGVARVTHDHTGADAQKIVCVIPLFALGFVGVSAGRDGAQFL